LEIGKNANGTARAAKCERSAVSQAGCSRLRRGYGEPRRSFSVGGGTPPIKK